MSHLRPTQSVRITRGGAAIPGTRTSTAAALEVEPWDDRVRAYAAAIGIDDQDVLDGFTTRLDETIEGLALTAGLDIEVARTKIVGAIAGATGMVTDLVDVDLSDTAIQGALADWDIEEPDAGDVALARLSQLYLTIVLGTAASDEPDVHVGQVAYALDVVPPNAKDVIAWIAEGDTADDKRARAQAAQEAETGRAEGPRTTVTAAIDDALADGG